MQFAWPHTHIQMRSLNPVPNYYLPGVAARKQLTKIHINCVAFLAM